ncbi:acyl-CoA thioesterase II, partial [Mycobacteroides abscessus subsp. massiliense]
PSAGFGRALTQGRIFNRDGTMVAAVVQEGLTRIERNPEQASVARGNMA